MSRSYRGNPSPRPFKPVLLPGREVLRRRPGAGDPRSVALGMTLMLVAGLVFFIGLRQPQRALFELDQETFVDRWNEAAAVTDRGDLELTMSPAIRPDGSDDLVFVHDWSDTMVLRGRIDPDTMRLVEIGVTGDPDLDGGERLANAMDLLVAATEPDLTGEERIETLQELGIVGGGTPDARAVRGGTDYVVGVGLDGRVGMGAAPAPDPG